MVRSLVVRGLGLRGLQRQPLALAGIAAGAGVLVGAAVVLRGRSSPAPTGPEEIVARALCREDPDMPTHIGPLW
ncbi:MAG: hypothetical protein JWQ97_4012, partial [Phenylobacterium sp.]|nr:hypothetical protein [Phenylobacterium sp.]